MHYWDTVLNEVLNKEEETREFFFTTHGRLDELTHAAYENESREYRTYFLGSEYPDVYITKREAETMFWVVQDYTNAYVAEKMDLSTRTIEFYVKNLRMKLQCKTKKELIEKILQTNLLQQLEKDGIKFVKH